MIMEEIHDSICIKLAETDEQSSKQNEYFYSFVITKVPAAIIMNAMKKATPGNSL